jgi:hypothetical protein
MAIAQEALKAAEAAKTAAEARPAIEAAAEEEAEAQGTKIGEDESRAIADALIAQMEARGAFTEGTPPEPPSAAESGGEPQGGPEPHPEAPVAPEAEESPRKPSLAERFQHKSGA